MKFFFAFVLLCALSFALDPRDFMPCSFQVMTHTDIMSGGEKLGESKDAFYHDHDNLWRWDSEFDGIPPIFEGHTWSAVWRPDYGNSYHDEGLQHECVLNDHQDKMPEFPIDWMLNKFGGGTSWTDQEVTIDGAAAIRYTATGHSDEYKIDLVFNLFFQDGEVLFANGTMKSDFIDIDYHTKVHQYTAFQPVPAKVFATCSSKDIPPTTLPADPSREFRNLCYRDPKRHSSSSAAFTIKPSFVSLFAAVLMVLLLCIAL